MSSVMLSKKPASPRCPVCFGPEHGPEGCVAARQARDKAQAALNQTRTPFKPDTKPTNPKDRVGILKIAFSVIPLTVLWELALAMLEGALKYGRHNYRPAGVRASVYFDAAVARHLAAWWEGEDIDAESGLNHITKAIASLTVLRDSMITGNWVDDRPPRTVPDGFLAGINQHVKTLLAKYPEPVAPFTEVGVKGSKT